MIIFLTNYFLDESFGPQNIKKNSENVMFSSTNNLFNGYHYYLTQETNSKFSHLRRWNLQIMGILLENVETLTIIGTGNTKLPI